MSDNTKTINERTSDKKHGALHQPEHEHVESQDESKPESEKPREI